MCLGSRVPADVTTLRSFLILWLATLPMSMIGEFGWLAPPALSFIAYLFLNVEQMAVEIEQPFGDDPNDLPQEACAAPPLARTSPPTAPARRPSPLPHAPRPTPNAQRPTPHAPRPTPTACLAAAACPSQEYILELEETLLEMLPGYEPPPTDDEDEGEADQPPQPYPHQMVALPPPNALPAGAQRAQQQAAANAMAAAGGTPGQGYGYPPGYYALPPNYHPGYPPPPQQQQMDQYALDQAWVGQQAWNNISPTWKQARTRPRPDERGGAPSNGQRSASAQRKR